MAVPGQKEISIDDIEQIPLEAYEQQFFEDDSGLQELSDDAYQYIEGADLSKGSDKVNKEPVKTEKPANRESKYRKPQADRAANASAESLEEFWQIPKSIENTFIGNLALELAEVHEFPEFSMLMILLASASVSVGCAYATTYDSTEPDSTINVGLYVVVEQPPGTGKSRALNFLTNPYHEQMTLHNVKVAAKNREISERHIEIPVMKPSFVRATAPTTASVDGKMARMAEGRFAIVSAEQSTFDSLFPQKGSFSTTNELLLCGSCFLA